MTSSPRVGWVDAVRALAILLMVVFHFCYDLRYFGYVDWQVPNGPGWRQFRYLILTLFLGTVGISLYLAQGHGIRWRSFWRRFLQIALAALAITLMSLVVFPQAWIYFGILHFIAVASLIALAFLSYPRIALGLGLGILLLYWSGLVSPLWPLNLIDQYLPDYTEDLVPLFPWLGVVLIGLWLGSLIQVGTPFAQRGVLPPWISFASRHSLAIYLIHQPILFAAFFVVGKYA